MLTESWEPTKVTSPEATSQWQQIRTATVGPTKTALTPEDCQFAQRKRYVCALDKENSEIRASLGSVGNKMIMEL